MKGEDIAFYIASAAQKSVLYEVSTTPKPGLVDRMDQGAHSDMDFFTFMNSSTAIYKGIYSCALEGFNSLDEHKNSLIDKLRSHGIRCEREMLISTEGVNTHKGAIFSLGLLSAATARLLRRKLQHKPYQDLGGKLSSIAAEEICQEVRGLTLGLTLKDFSELDSKKNLTAGERLFKEYGIRGIRGEAESGFSTVEKVSLPILRRWNYERDLPLNDLFLELLINLMAYNEDTNVISRRGLEGLKHVQASARGLITLGGVRNPHYLDLLIEINRDFIKRNISPGGSADLLAVSIFLAILEGIVN